MIAVVGNTSNQQTVISNHTQQSIRRGKDGAYISFQTNVDNT
jgi:hypothetical protein